jgi:ABC-type dipeptide/oligopeptide/nickel transport system permease subunit
MIREILYIALGFIIGIYKGDEIINWLIQIFTKLPNIF